MPIEERLRKQQGLSACLQKDNTSVSASDPKSTADLAQTCCFSVQLFNWRKMADL